MNETSEDPEEVQAIKLYVRARVAERFRKAAMSVYGYGRGALSQAGQVALGHWSTSASVVSSSEIKNPVQAIAGLLASEKKSSVAVQHEMPMIWAQNVARELDAIKKKRK